MRSGIFGGLTALLLACFPFGCGNNSSSGNDSDDPKPTYDMKNGVDNDINDMKDQGYGKDSSTGINRAPSVVLVDREGVAVKDIKVRAGMNWEYQVKAEDPDGDTPLECKLNVKDDSKRLLYDSGWTNCGNYRYNIAGEGSYDLEAQAKDPKGMESISYSVAIVAMKNVPPVAKLKCNEFDPQDDRCVYRAKIDESFCVDGTPSYDIDGKIVKFRMYGDVNNLPNAYVGGIKPMICTSYNKSSKFLASFKTIDDDNAEDHQLLYIFIN